MRKFVALITGLALVFSSLGVMIPLEAHAKPPGEIQEKKISPEISATKGKHVSVIVEMKTAPVAVFDDKSVTVKNEHRDGIEKKQKELADEIKKISPDIQVGEAYDTVFSGMEVTVDGADLKKLADLPDVKHIYPVRTYQTTMKGSAPLIGAPDAWKEKDSRGQSVTGKGMKVAVIDTGVDATHPDLKKNVIGGYDFVDKDETPQDGDGHGTHVAGTIAANGKIKGVAPEASILAYRVLDDNGMGDTADILAAVDQAVKDGADVMNLSLGMDVNVPDEPLSWALERAVKNGVVAVVANGNAGPRRWTAGSPAASSHVISVGASTKKDPVPVVQAVGDSKKVELNEISFSPEIPLKGTYPIVDAGTGKTGELKNAKGKVALVKRTGNDVNRLAKRAKKAGAAAVMVYNDKGGDWFADILMPGMDHEGKLDNSMFAPIGTLSNKHGLHLKKQMETGKTHVRFRSVKREKMTDFSSRGPAAGNWEIKPDIVAPGHNIVSTVPKKAHKSGYDSMSGTSMAAPHVAGAAALVLQKNPEWTPQEVKAALSNTAVTLIDTEQKPYPKALQGAGRIDLMKALHTKNLALPSSLSFGLLKPDTGVQQSEKSLQVKNLDSRKKTYRTRLTLDKRNKGFTVDVPTAVTIQPHETASIPVTLNIDTRLSRGEYTGTLYLKDGSDEIKVPFQVLIDPKGYPLINNLSTSEFYISPNGDGRLDTIVLSYYLPVSPDELTITLHRDIEKKATHTIYRAKQPEEGAVDWVWDGKDIRGNTVKDGEYSIQATAKFLGRKGEDISFVIVDSTPPKIQVDKPAGQPRLSGKVKEANLERMHWRIEGETGWKRIRFEHEKDDTWKFRKLFKKDELKKGKNQVTIRAIDAAGNISTKKVTVTIP
ncbi:S8 family serine peptidase [Desmospora profundinema]|uniref:Minor extracellular serine protease Vpr n=1 Tax=Desmospora profundinema TaxID=1571184 RepID=A0ABU1IPN4_9BACL|nr:S8 family serine peptidase [Desmospora profundinema]MDR6225715.1 minor extracellular serine protease Vpr [Desmospora profundinema]